MARSKNPSEEAAEARRWRRVFDDGRGAALEMARLWTRLPELSRHPRGSGETVLVLPGLGAGDGSTVILRNHLRRLGYQVHGWGLGINSGDVPKLLRRVIEKVLELSRASGAPVKLVGWSLGGYLAREAAREVPHAVDRVITLGSPVIGGPRHTAVAPLYRRAGASFDAIDAIMARRELRPIEVPIVAIYSEEDGIVDWHACIDRKSPRVEHVRVRATHLGLGFAPEVLRIVAERLAEDGSTGERAR